VCQPSPYYPSDCARPWTRLMPRAAGRAMRQRMTRTPRSRGKLLLATLHVCGTGYRSDLLSLQYPQFALSSDKIVFGDAEVIGTEEGVGRRGGLFTLPFCGARSPRVVPRAPLASVRQTSRICGSPRLIGTSDPDANGDGRPARGCGRGSCRNGMRNRDRNAGVISCWGDLERSDENTA
jgi:hypothetical protein